ncbi:TorF family putative porin [Pseudomonas sp. Marseille-Q8238]
MRFSGSIITAAALCLAATHATALPLSDSGFSLDTTLTALSDYRSRGISQTLGDPALQVTSVLSHESGAYLALFTSNYDLGKATREWDYIAGWTIPLADEVALDLGWAKYEYHGESVQNYSEYYGSLSAYGVTLGAHYSDDLADKESYFYGYLGYSVALPFETTLDLRYARSDYKDEVFFNTSGKGRSRYDDWQVSLSRAWLGLDWKASYIDTNLSKSECLSYSGYDDLCGATLVAEVGKTF